MSRAQIPYTFFAEGLNADRAALLALGINQFYPNDVPIEAEYGFIAYRPAGPLQRTGTNDDTILFADGPWRVEAVLARDADIDDLGPIEDLILSRFHGKKFTSTASGVLESCRWVDTFDVPYDVINGTYPRRIFTFAIVV
jgi:hypothetical protein